MVPGGRGGAFLGVPVGLACRVLRAQAALLLGHESRQCKQGELGTQQHSRVAQFAPLGAVFLRRRLPRLPPRRPSPSLSVSSSEISTYDGMLKRTRLLGLAAQEGREMGRQGGYEPA